MRQEITVRHKEIYEEYPETVKSIFKSDDRKEALKRFRILVREYADKYGEPLKSDFYENLYEFSVAYVFEDYEDGTFRISMTTKF